MALIIGYYGDEYKEGICRNEWVFHHLELLNTESVGLCYADDSLNIDYYNIDGKLCFEMD